MLYFLHESLGTQVCRNDSTEKGPVARLTFPRNARGVCILEAGIAELGELGGWCSWLSRWFESLHQSEHPRSLLVPLYKMSCQIPNPYRAAGRACARPSPQRLELPTAFRVSWGQTHDQRSEDFYASGHARVPLKPPPEEARAKSHTSTTLIIGKSLYALIDQHGISHIRSRSDEALLLTRFSKLNGGFRCA